MRIKNIFNYFIHYLLLCFSMIESVFLLSKKYCQVYLSNTIVNNGTISFTVTNGNIHQQNQWFIFSFTNSIQSFMILNVILTPCLMSCFFGRTSNSVRKVFVSL